MAWVNCTTAKMVFREFAPMIDELADALDERYTAMRYVLQNDFSADIRARTITDYETYRSNIKKFLIASRVLRNMFPRIEDLAMYTDGTGDPITAGTTRRITITWSRTAGTLNAFGQSRYNFTGGVGPWYNSVPGTSTISDYGSPTGSIQCNGFLSKNLEKIIIDEAIRFMNRMYYFQIKEETMSGTTIISTRSTMYNFYNGTHAGVANFVYGENALI